MDGGPSWNPIHDHEGAPDLEYFLLSPRHSLPDSSLLSRYLHARPQPPNSTSSPYIPCTPSIMSAVDAPVENFTELDAAGGIEIVQETQNVGQVPQINETAAVGSEKKWPGWPGESVFRILVPSPKVGGIIGRKGEYIKKTCEESRARIKILDGPPGAPERAVIISAKEEPQSVIPPAIDGLLRVHKRTIDGFDGEQSFGPPNAGIVIKTRLLVAASQAGSLIGKQGSTIKSIQEASNSVVRIIEDLPVLALHDDRVVEIQGEPSGVHKAVELIAGQLRKFLVDKSVLPLFEVNMCRPNAHMEHNMPPPPQTWGPPQGPPHNAPSGYGGNPPPFMPAGPPRPHDAFYPPPPELPPAEKPPHHGVATYGRQPPHLGTHPSNPPQAAVSQVTQHMQIPLSYADAVIGTSGASISYIRRASGATITIQETRGVPGEMTVEINGSATQVQTAQQLIHNFMAEAAPPPQSAAPSVDPAYSSYPSHGNNMYMSAPPANTGPAAPPPGGYGAGYGTNYGY